MSIRFSLVVLALFASLSLCAQGYYIKNYDVKMEQAADGSLSVVEDITVFYEEKRQGIDRFIPYRYKWEGKKIRVKIYDIEVPDYNSKTRKKNGQLRVRIGTKGEFLTGEHSYKIKYKVKGHIAAYEDFTELYWNVIPDKWKTKIDAYSFSVSFEKPLDLAFNDYKVFSGDSGKADNSSKIQYRNNVLRGRSTTSLKARQGVTIAVKMPSNYIPADLISKTAIEINGKPREPMNNSPWTWFVSVISALGLFQLRQKIDGRKQHDDNAKLQFYPPENMSAAQVGFFIDHKPNTRDIMSLIPQWGAEGLIYLEKQESDTKITKKDKLPKGLPVYEHTLFDAIFKEDDVVYLKDLKYKIAGSLHKAQTQLAEEQKESDLYDETSMYYLHSWRTIIAGLLLFALGALAIIFLKSIVLCATFILMGFALLFIYFTEPKLSDTGVRIKNHLLGMERFLKNHDGSEYASLMKKDPMYFDKIFPYAVALGTDTNFLKLFGEHVDYSPMWYGYYGVGLGSNSTSRSMGGFAQDFNVQEITSVFSSVNSSSGGRSGGGFSGGGSVGGGFGGGGGGSW